jgi:nitrate reductase gamma subunit
MTLLEFARGPGLYWATVIFVVGIVWRVAGALLLPRLKDYSKARDSADIKNGIRTIITRSAPAHELEKNIKFQHYTGYIWHIGLFIVIFFYGPHVEFFKDVFGFRWPNLPTNVITLSAAVTMAVLVALLIRRMIHPVLKMISNLDDYISWLVSFLPLLTGAMAFAHIGARYEVMLAIHILSVELLMVWFPFGKLIHGLTIWPSRYQLGVTFGRRGIKA